MVQEVAAFWDKHRIVESAVAGKDHAKGAFTFYEGPPSANGRPGIHHWMARTIKDLFCRYKAMQGYGVARRAGWDAHGLPVELAVEKTLGIHKEDIGTHVSIESFTHKCREAVGQYRSEWERLTTGMGFWMDQQRPYVTCDAPYIESLWWLLKRLYEQDLLYLGHTIQPYSPAAGTSLSQHELNQPGCYRPTQSHSLTVQFKVEGMTDTYLLAWTTTAWTLPANAALAVGANIGYVRLRTLHPLTGKEVSLILAKACLHRYFSPEGEGKALLSAAADAAVPYQIEAHYTGKELAAMTYVPLMRFKGLSAPEVYQVHTASFVSTDEGTGIVHMSPTFGADDYQLAKKVGIASVLAPDERGVATHPIVDARGRFRSEVSDFAGLYVRNAFAPAGTKLPSADRAITEYLQSRDLLFHTQTHLHSYPHCWRTDKPIIYYPVSSWCIRCSAVKERLLALNQSIHWHPSTTGEGRFAHWLAHLEDWNLSRTRFWGTPLPVWISEDGHEKRCIGSFEELQQEMQTAIQAGFMKTPDKQPTDPDFDPHRPYIDDFVLKSPSGKKMRRSQDVLDVWFDSGAMPYAQWHYPFENKRAFAQAFPADFIAEGVDQTRGWFFTLHAIAGMVFDQVAFKHVVSTGFVLDKKGNKMSKRTGNTVDPFDILAQYGADAPRWYFVVHAPPWENVKFDPKGIEQIQRRFFDTLKHVLQFFVMYARLDNFHYPKKPIPLQKRPIMDRWMGAALDQLVAQTTTAMEAYQPTTAARAIQDFVVDTLSNWYVRLNRKRFWKSEQGADKQSAYETLYESLHAVVQLMAPYAPFITEAMYQRLKAFAASNASLSVHQSPYPKPLANDPEGLLRPMAHVQHIVSMAHALRKQVGIKVRQPLARIMVSSADYAQLKKMIAPFAQLITQESNTKVLEYLPVSHAMLVKGARLDFKKAGARYGAKVQALKKVVEQLSEGALRDLEAKGNYQVKVEGDEILLQRDEVEVFLQAQAGFCAQSDGGITVALDLQLTDELKSEGWAREIVNRIQNMRKNASLEPNDSIRLCFATPSSVLQKALNTHLPYIERETLCHACEFQSTLNKGETFSIDTHPLTIQLRKT